MSLINLEDVMKPGSRSLRKKMKNTSWEQRVYNYIQAQNKPVTSSQIRSALKYKHASSRINTLETKGLIQKVGVTTGISGRQAYCYQVKEQVQQLPPEPEVRTGTPTMKVVPSSLKNQLEAKIANMRKQLQRAEEAYATLTDLGII